VDHSADPLAFIKDSYFTSRTQDLPIFGPEGNALMPPTIDYATRFLDANGPLSYLSVDTHDKSQAAHQLKAHNIPLMAQNAKGGRGLNMKGQPPLINPL
jgi:ribonuclease BN (tRNA processing enzyme)